MAIQESVLKTNIANFWANVKWAKQKKHTYSSSAPATLSPMQLQLQKAGLLTPDGQVGDAPDVKPQFSLSESTADIAPIHGGYNVYGKDLKLDKQPEAPLPDIVPKNHATKNRIRNHEKWLSDAILAE